MHTVCFFQRIHKTGRFVPAALLLLVSMILLPPACRAAPTTAPATRPSDEPDPTPQLVDRLIIISIDGLRPDLLLRAETPNLRGLMRRGTFTMWAMTTDVGITLPSHVSMLTGCKPQKHNIHYNGDPGPDQPPHPVVPTLFDLAAEEGLTSMLVSGKRKFNSLKRSVTYPSVMEGPDDKLTDAAIKMIEEHRPTLAVVHLPGTDSAGHSIGWGTPQQIAAIEKADACVGRLLEALERLELLEGTAILISADHGGQGRTHGGVDARTRHIPWILAGPGVHKNFDLTTLAQLRVHTEDTFATACLLLGLKLPDGIDGKPIDVALENLELLSK
jgi:predicted AlkP superfamily pyrophosphatase or phosphodiesterase